jgi:hypothetical protein
MNKALNLILYDRSEEEEMSRLTCEAALERVVLQISNDLCLKRFLTMVANK